MYEGEITEKNKEDNVSITPVRDEITNDDIQQCIEKRAERRPEDFDMATVEKCIKKVHMKMNVSSAENRIDVLVLDYINALESAGFGSIRTDCPKLAIGHTYERLKPPLLKELVDDEFKKYEKNGLRKEDFNFFIAELVKLAKIAERTGAGRRNSVQSSNEDKSSQKNSKNDNSRQKRGRGNGEGRNEKKVEEEPTKKRKKSTPPSLHPDCNESHNLDQCPICKNDAPLRAKLLKQYRERKASENAYQGKKTMNRLGKDSTLEQSTLFSAKPNQYVEALVVADQGSDVNLMPPDVFEKLIKADPKIQWYI